MEAPRYVIFDLDDTLVHSDAVRTAFASVADERGIDRDVLTRTLDGFPGRAAREIFEALGLSSEQAGAATDDFLSELDELNGQVPTVAYPDADMTLRELAAGGSTLMLSTGSSSERARKVLEQEGWDDFTVVLGSDSDCTKGTAHYERMTAQAPDAGWTRRAVTIGDSPRDMRLGAEHGIPVRIGINRGGGDPIELIAAGATHIVRRLADIMPILAAAPAFA